MSSKTYSQIQIRSERGDALQPFIRLYANGAFVRNYKIEQGTTIVGRDYSCGIVLDDRYLSRRHFLLEYDGHHRLYVQDLNSRNGTFVNEQKVQRSALGHGDKLAFGIYEFAVSFPSRSEENVVIPFPNVVTEPKLPMITDEAVEEAQKVDPKRLPRPLLSTKEASVVPSRLVKSNLILPHWVRENALYMGGVVISLLTAWFAYPLVSTMLAPSAPPTEQVATTNTQSPEENEAPATQPRKTGIKEKVSKLFNRNSTASRTSPPSEIKAPSKPSNPGASEASKRKMLEDMQKSIGSVLDGTDLSKVGKDLKNQQGADDRVAMNLKPTEAVKPLTADTDIELPEQKRGLSPKSFPTGTSVEMVDARSYQKVIKSRMVVAQHCYADFVGEKALKGKVIVAFSIMKNGQAKNSSIKHSTLNVKAVHECILQELKEMEFETPPWDHYEVNYTFHFGSSKTVDFSSLLLPAKIS